MNLPVPSTVDRDTTTSLARVASGGVVVIVTHTINTMSISATLITGGTANIAAARVRKKLKCYSAVCPS
jgi:hypothetical protein